MKKYQMTYADMFRFYSDEALAELRKQFWVDWNDNKHHGEGGGGG